MITVIGEDKNGNYGFEIYDYRQERLIGTATVGKYPILEVNFHPKSLNTIALCGVNFLSIWRFNGKMITCKKEVMVNKVFLCMIYLDLHVGTKDVDILLGTTEGEFYLYIEGTLLPKQAKAHEGAIN